MPKSLDPLDMCRAEQICSDHGAYQADFSCLDAGLEIRIMSSRADFLHAAKARRSGQAGFLLQARARFDTSHITRIGFTCSKKLGNAVTRNRAKRRLREIARLTLPTHARQGWDYVLVGRPGQTVSRGFSDLLDDLVAALHRVHQ